MPRLTIRGEDAGAGNVLKRLSDLIQTAERATNRLQGVAGTVAGQYRAAGDEIRRSNRVLQQAQRETVRQAQQARTIAGHYQAATSSVQQLAGAERQLQQSTIRTAGAAKTLSVHYRDASTRLARTTRQAVALAAANERAARSARALARGSRVGTTSGVDTGAATAAAAGAVASGVSGLLRGAVRGFGSAISGVLSGAAKTFIGALGGVKGLLLGAVSAAGSVLGGAIRGVSAILRAGVRTAVNLFRLGLTGAATATVAILAGSLRQAIRQQPLERGFGAIVESRGLGEQAEVLERLRTAARGTVSDLNLMLQTNRAVVLGAANSVPQLELLIEAGRRLGQAMGRTAAEGFEDLALGIGRQSRLILDNLGLQVRVRSANEAYAASLGKTVDQLTDAEQKIAFQNAAFSAIRRTMADLGPETESVATKMARLRATIGNTANEIGRQLLPSVSRLTDTWSRFIKSIEGTDVLGVVRSIGSTIRSAIGGALDFVFGSDSDIRTSIRGLGGDIVRLVVNPSSQAFEIVKLRAQILFEDLKVFVGNLWDGFREQAVRALATIEDVRAALQFNPLAPSRGDILRAGAGSLRSERGEDRAARRNAAVEPLAARINTLLRLISNDEFLRQSEAQRRIAPQAAAARGDGFGVILAQLPQLVERGVELIRGRQEAQAQKDQDERFRTLAEAMGENTKALRDTAQGAVREGVLTSAPRGRQSRGQSVADAQAAEVRRALDAQVLVLERNRDVIEREIARREESISSLAQAATESQRIAEGFEASRDIGERLNDLTANLSEANARVDSISQALAEARNNLAAELAAVRQQLKDDILAASKEFSNALRSRSREFLLGGEVEGTTVRVRAQQRRAQRERRRRNADLLNDAFRSRGVDSGFGPVGGFGAQNIERAGFSFSDLFGRSLQGFGAGETDARNVLDQRFPELEEALARLVNEDGTTLLEEQQARIVALVEEAAGLEKEQTDRIAELEAEEAAAIEDRNAIGMQQVDLLRKVLESLATERSQRESLRRDLDRVRSELDRIGRLAKSR